MPIIDRAISLISPKWSAERMAWRKIENSYRGGVGTRTSEFWQREQGYRLGTMADRAQLARARDRAYQAYKDNPVARTLVDTETDNVIGDGLNYQPTTDSEAWNREAKDRYYAWIDQCSVRGSDCMSGAELQRLLWTQSRIAGDIGWVLVSRGNDSFIEVIDSEKIVTPDGMFAQGEVTEGIRYDSSARPVTFYVLRNDEWGKREFVPVPARDFVFLPHFLNASKDARGATCYLTIFETLAHLDRYVDGVALAAWMATVFGIVFKQNNASRSMAALPSLTNSQGEQQKAVTFENGMVKYVGTDEEVAQVQATQPMNQTEPFIRTLMRLLGQPFNMPLAIVFKDTSQENFASARIGLLPFYRSCRIKAAWFGTHWSRTIRWWLSRERLRADNDPKKWRTAFPENYWNHDLLVNAWSYTDPVSEAQGDHLELDMKTKSPQMVIAERGRDAEVILRDWEEWNKKTADLPQLHSTMTRDPLSQVPGQGREPANNEPEEDDDEPAE